MCDVVNTLVGICLYIVPISEDMLLLVTYQVAQLATFTVSTNPLGWGLAVGIYLACCYLVTTNLVVWLVAAWQLQYLVGYRSEVGCNIPLEVLAVDDVGTYLHLETRVAELTQVGLHARETGVTWQTDISKQVIGCTVIVVKDEAQTVVEETDIETCLERLTLLPLQRSVGKG